MPLPDRGLDSIRAYWNGELVGSAEMSLRQDVADAFPWLPHAGRSGFFVRLPRRTVEAALVGQLDLVGCQGSRHVARMSTLFRADLGTAVPAPPEALMSRVGASATAQAFRLEGLKLFGELMEPIRRHRGSASVGRLLDWGCGCGRVSAHFLLEPEIAEVFGCDVDAEAVQWCRDSLRPGRFSHIGPWPPTHYEDATFDVVVGVSVLTYLAGDVQRAWLAEVRRITAPGGLFLASTHGVFAARFAFPETFARLLRDGIYFGVRNPSLGGIVPEGYYRDVYQTREYTVREWSRYFEIREYIERGIGNHQDLVVMRRPA
jgi:SAM-dependent methyltransferase